MRTAIVLTALLTLTAAGVARAQPPGEALAGVYACAEIADDAARLACFDREVGRVRAAEAAGEIKTIASAQIEQIRRDSFGFRLPSLAALSPLRLGDATPEADEEAEAPLEAITATIASVSGGGGAPLRFRLDNGQVWRVIDSKTNRLARAGAEVRIRRAALGSFLMLVEAGGSALRVRREE